MSQIINCDYDKRSTKSNHNWCQDNGINHWLKWVVSMASSHINFSISMMHRMDFPQNRNLVKNTVNPVNHELHNNKQKDERSGKTRQLHASHVTTGDRLWSSLPGLRPLATITHDTLDWYGWDEDGAGVHDVIGTRCDPHTNFMLHGVDYDYCCHSNLTRSLVKEKGLPVEEAELHVHDVLNVFMCTGFTKDTHQYFMKASPVKPGDFIEFFAEIDLLGSLSTCPGGDCGSSHSDDDATCYPLLVEIYKPKDGVLDNWKPIERNAYSGTHGL
ncbi:hypothetical protein GQR58_023560 [Nymphon striatum]|nr:hypothetical protein GQR58_023560 [Nymphon striatum]